MSKAANIEIAAGLTDVPNIGPAIANDLKRLGITWPAELAGQDPNDLYTRLCKLDKRTHDVCVLDVFAAAVEFAEGRGNRPWWEVGRERRELAATSG